MTRVLLLAALALACVTSPAMAGTHSVGLRLWSGTAMGYQLALAMIVIGAQNDCFRGRLRRSFQPRQERGWALMFAAVAVMLVIGTPVAFAAELGTIGDKAVILPWGDWLVALAVSLREPILTILIPIIAGYVIQAIRKVYPWATLFLSQRRVEMMLEAAVGFGLNAVQGAAKGKTLSANVAVPVIAKGTQYVIDTAPPAVIKAAGGADGIAARMFRKLDLDDHASEANVLVPAQVQIGAGTVSAEELREADRMVRG